jgi:RNA polymerase sigma-70 factor (ECF subfamily)
MRGIIENDKILTLRAGHGDAEAFGILFDRYSKRIYRYIYFKVTVKETAEDLASHCFLKIWEQINNGLKVKNFRSLVYRIARNLVIDYYRTREREELPLIYQLEQESEEKLEVKFDEDLKQEQLEKILLNLKSEVREIVLLRFVDELSIKEIARIVEKSSSNIRVIIHRALKDLNSYLK